MSSSTLNWDKLSKILSIDFNKYKSKEISEAISALVNTPYNLVFQFIVWPLLFIVIFVVTGIFVIWPISWTAGILWVLTALLIGPLCGITVATYIVVARLDDSSKQLYEATLNAVIEISLDIKQNVDKIPSDLELPNYKELLRFVKLGLVFPVLKELMIKKLWPFGNWIGNIVVNYLKKVSQKSEQLLKDESIPQNSSVAALIHYAEKIQENTELLKSNLDNAHKIATNLTLAPIRFSMLMSFFLIGFFLLLIWYFFLL